MFEFEAGKSYTIRLTIKNASTRGGLPVAANLGVGILAMAGVMLIERQVQPYSFAPGENRTFSFPMDVPMEASGPGGITAWVEDPGGRQLVKVTEDILIEGYKVYFSGHVSDAETGQPLSGVAVELIINESPFASTVTDSSGFYEFSNIPVPSTMQLVFMKSGYQDTVTQQLPLGPSGGGLDIEMIPLVPTTLVLYYRNPRGSGTTHWNVYDLRANKWMAEGLPKLITEAISYVPTSNKLLMLFKEARNAFFDEAQYGPYSIEITGLGQYTWDAATGKLNGVAAANLQGKSGSIRGTVTSQTFDGQSYWLGIRIDSATTTPGMYLIGLTVQAKYGLDPGGNLTGMDITATLKHVSGLAWEASNIGFPSGYPSWYYNFRIDAATSYGFGGYWWTKETEGWNGTTCGISSQTQAVARVNFGIRSEYFGSFAIVVVRKCAGGYSWKRYPNGPNYQLQNPYFITYPYPEGGFKLYVNLNTGASWPGESQAAGYGWRKVWGGGVSW